ncbi:hypothetical protein [Bizionia myxarmorum]|uniref:Uncharacterized protein n=1 Tax=Bizionia myxarmorum TaxID=291186 RepID=A0A5D0R9X9_9FLAO|nr:hypothetical protein [Bizionia myxarmorum]TYB78312.1 hypothetical protein ES674_00600 [Bizionia myxarmorum]
MPKETVYTDIEIKFNIRDCLRLLLGRKLKVSIKNLVHYNPKLDVFDFNVTEDISVGRIFRKKPIQATTE